MIMGFPFKIYTPPVEDFEIVPQRGRKFSNAPTFCVIFS